MVEAAVRESGWQLEGNAARAYEAYLVPAYFAGCAEALVKAAGVAPGDRLLDVACGTGVVARAAARRVGPGGSVSGVDINPQMLDVAREAVAAGGLRVDFREGDARDLPFPDDSFDVVLCEEALQFVPDRLAAVSEMRRVGRAGARIAFRVLRSLEHNVPYARFADLLEEYAGPEAGEMMRSPFALGDGESLRRLALDAGLGDVELRIGIDVVRYPSVEALVRGEAASSPLAGPLSALDDATREALLEAAQRALAPHVDDAGVTFATETHVVLARA